MQAGTDLCPDTLGNTENSILCADRQGWGDTQAGAGAGAEKDTDLEAPSAVVMTAFHPCSHQHSACSWPLLQADEVKASVAEGRVAGLGSWDGGTCLPNLTVWQNRKTVTRKLPK